MAKATLVAPKRPDVTLLLSANEADTLVSVLSKVGGQPSTSPRGIAQAILEALVEATGRNWQQVKHYNLATGGITMQDYTSGVTEGDEA